MQPMTIAKTSQLPIVTSVVVDEWPVGTATQLRVQMVGNGLGQIIHVPVIIVRGRLPGPTLGVTAAIHGDELNGIGLIHRLLEGTDPEQLSGTLIAVPVVNVPGYLREERRFPDDRDLNRIMPGKPDGIPSEVYAHRFLERIAKPFDYLVDLHTASAGRVNSFYVRANLHHEITAWMALAQYPDIILHNEARDGTFRGAMMDAGVPAITIELGNPKRLQRKVVRMGTEGLFNIMGHIGMIEHEMHEARKRKPVICTESKWLYTQSGGILRVFPDLGDKVRRGSTVAAVHDIYGNLVEEYVAPYDGVVIGKSVNPVNQTGSRILHLGRVANARQLRSDFPFVTEATRGDQ
jgi:predicted deacylase